MEEQKRGHVLVFIALEGGDMGARASAVKKMEEARSRRRKYEVTWVVVCSS